MGESSERRLPWRYVAPLVVGVVLLAVLGMMIAVLWGVAGIGSSGGDDASGTDDATVASSSQDDAADVVPSVVATAGADLADDAAVGLEVDTHVSTVAVAHGEDIDVYDEPDGEVALELRSKDVLTVPGQTPLVMLVSDVEPAESGEAAAGGDDAAAWYEVYLPVRPNGSTGWVRADDVDIQLTEYWISVDLSAFTLTVYEGTEAVLATEIGVGRDDRPTPGGVYYVKELLRVPDPTGPYGPYAYGLSGFQSTLETFNGGDAVIGIHGTNDETSFGRVVSSGCLRLPNAAITEMAEEIGLPLGTPVYIEE
ncbi:L,D-transpeptidase [Demequina sp. NBRC 110054]|uniref:L,D-transpeptidase n=1 Tax=Demequina sp. NBRC 110054 TaxID=1570343 RepID=UPI001177C34B|nr:L,D-transpeptidase [Demequina sp. NBRC 110054]